MNYERLKELQSKINTRFSLIDYEKIRKFIKYVVEFFIRLPEETRETEKIKELIQIVFEETNKETLDVCAFGDVINSLSNLQKHLIEIKKVLPSISNNKQKADNTTNKIKEVKNASNEINSNINNNNYGQNNVSSDKNITVNDNNNNNAPKNIIKKKSAVLVSVNVEGPALNEQKNDLKDKSNHLNEPKPVEATTSVINDEIENQEQEQEQEQEENQQENEENQNESDYLTDLSPEENIALRNIKSLDRYLMELSKKINELEATELTIDDMNSEVSIYIIEEKLKTNYDKTYKKLNDLCLKYPHLIDPSVKPKRKIEKHSIFRKIKLNQCISRHPEIDAEIEKNLNKTKQFPDYLDVVEWVTNANKASNLGLDDRRIGSIAEDCFKEIGRIIKERRYNDDRLIWKSRIDSLRKLNKNTSQSDSEAITSTNQQDEEPESQEKHVIDELNIDPADSDSNLDKKLKENKKKADEQQNKIFDDYVAKQMENSNRAVDYDQEDEEDECDETTATEESSSETESDQETDSMSISNEIEQRNFINKKNENEDDDEAYTAKTIVEEDIQKVIDKINNNHKQKETPNAIVIKKSSNETKNKTREGTEAAEESPSTTNIDNELEFRNQEEITAEIAKSTQESKKRSFDSTIGHLNLNEDSTQSSTNSSATSEELIKKKKKKTSITPLNNTRNSKQAIRSFMVPSIKTKAADSTTTDIDSTTATATTATATTATTTTPSYNLRGKSLSVNKKTLDDSDDLIVID